MEQAQQILITKLIQREAVACRQFIQEHHSRLVSIARTIVGDGAEDYGANLLWVDSSLLDGFVAGGNRHVHEA